MTRPSTTANAAAFPATLSLGNYPNPAQAFTVIRFAIPASISAAVPLVKLTVYDMRGQRIKTLAESRLGAGRHSLRWDVRDENGRLVAAGMYRLLLEADGKRMSRALQESQEAFVRNAPYVDFRGRTADEISPTSFRVEGRNQGAPS